MRIWYREFSLEEIKEMTRNTLDEALGIEYVEVGPDYLTATMPVDQRTVQPLGWLHGGASVALAESLGSIAATMCVDPEKKYLLGIAINTSHIKSVKAPSRVFGTAQPLHVGNTIHVWEIHITDENDFLVSVSRITLLVRDYR